MLDFRERSPPATHLKRGQANGTHRPAAGRRQAAAPAAGALGAARRSEATPVALSVRSLEVKCHRETRASAPAAARPPPPTTPAPPDWQRVRGPRMILFGDGQWHQVQLRAQWTDRMGRPVIQIEWYVAGEAWGGSYRADPEKIRDV